MSDRAENASAGGGPNGTAPSDASSPSPEGEAPRPLGVVMASAVNGFRALFRKQAELAKLEVSEAAGARAAGVGMMVAGGVLALFALGFAAAAGAAALALVMPAWAADLIVAAVFVLVMIVLVLVGRHAIRTAPTATRTRETLKEDARWARQQIAR